jgi:hypothetical protein
MGKQPQQMQSPHTDMQPQLVVQLASQQAPPAGGGGGGAWLQLSPDTMHQHRLQSQQLVLVSVRGGLCARMPASTVCH